MPAPGPSTSVVIRPLHPLSPNCLHMPTAGSTIQLFATALDANGLIVSTTFTWSSDNAGVATVNSSTGVVTGVASGICNIQGQANDSGAAKSSIAVGVALLSTNTISLAYGNSTTISSVGGFNTANWCGGCPGAAEVIAGTIVNGFVTNSANPSLGWNPGPTATIITPIYQGPISFTATAHVPIFASVGGIYCMATANITGVPNWAGA
jgi:hypothetical protein